MNNIVEKAKQYTQGKIALHFMHGRDDPEEDLDDWGYNGPVLFFDWIHITYLSNITFGFGEEEFVNRPEISFNNDLVKITDGTGKTSYYGDWEIIPASEGLMLTGGA